jgi:hydrogenase expression/formation protein HypE
MDERNTILLAHGGGGRLMEDLIRRVILPHFGRPEQPLLDAARVSFGTQALCFTTDSFVVRPLFFPGGDIGKLAVCGTVNDLAVSGARPLVMSLSFIIEEGFAMDDLQTILSSIAQAADKAGVSIVTGDTKVVERGAADGLFINTAGIGLPLRKARLGFERIAAGDRILINGTLGDHGMTVLSKRGDIPFDGNLQSDCACLNGLIEQLIEACGPDVKFMRDPTRGGLAAVLNEIAAGASVSIEIEEAALPIQPAVRSAAEMLGLDILHIANEGKVLAVVSESAAPRALEVFRNHPLGRQAAWIGRIAEAGGTPLVELCTRIGGRRIVPMPYGRDLPRIC